MRRTTTTKPPGADLPTRSQPRDLDTDPTPEENAAALRAWASLWGTADEMLLLASSPAEADDLNRRARAVLTETGRLRGPTVQAGEIDLSPGDRVVAAPGGIAIDHLHPLRGWARPSGWGVPEACPGDVRLIDPAGRWAVVDFPTFGSVRLAETGLRRLRHAYALAVAPNVGTRIAGLRVIRPGRVGIDTPGA